MLRLGITYLSHSLKVRYHRSPHISLNQLKLPLSEAVESIIPVKIAISPSLSKSYKY